LSFWPKLNVPVLVVELIMATLLSLDFSIPSSKYELV